MATQKRNTISRRLFRLSLFGFLLPAFFAPQPTNAGASFVSLGDLGGEPEFGNFMSRAYGVSGDGRTVVGDTLSPDGRTGFRWTAGGGMQDFGPLADGLYGETWAIGASRDGSVIIGNADGGGFYWTAEGGMARVAPPSFERRADASGISSDGSTIVGWGLVDGQDDSEAFVYRRGGDMQFLGTMPGGGWTGATAVNADGSVIVGDGLTNGEQEPYIQPFRWTVEDGIQPLGRLHQGFGHTRPNAVTPDGRVIVGEVFTLDPFHYSGFRWTEGTGYEALGDFIPLGVTDNGSFIVGTDEPSTRAMVWSEEGGLRELSQFLENEYGLDINGWTLLSAQAVSADGTVIVGYGTDAMGHSRGYVVTIPEPGTVVLLALGATCCFVRRRGRSGNPAIRAPRQGAGV